ncbi:hypothetical protein SDRG_15133, partial [Saprolegnia diclina VS20]
MESYTTLDDKASTPTRRARHIQRYFARYDATAGDDNDVILAFVHTWSAHQHLWRLAHATYEPPLHHACRNGNIDGVNRLLNDGTCALYQDATLSTALHVAVAHGHVACVDRLLQERDIPLQLHVQNHRGETPLHVALKRKRYIMADSMLQHASTATLQRLDNNGWSIQALDVHQRGCLHEACRNGSVARLQHLTTTYKLPLDAALPQLQWSLLHQACASMHIDCVRSLLAQVPHLVFQADQSGATPLHVCAAHGFLEGIVLLLDAAIAASHLPRLLSAVDVNGRTALHTSLLRRQRGIAMYLLTTSQIHGLAATDFLALCDVALYTALHYAAAIGANEIVRALIDAGVNIEHGVPSTTYLTKENEPDLATATRRRPLLAATTLQDVQQSVIELKTLWFAVHSRERSHIGDAPSVTRFRHTKVVLDASRTEEAPTSPLLVALRGRQYETAQLLLDAGADAGHGTFANIFLQHPQSRPVLTPFANQWLASPAPYDAARCIPALVKSVCKGQGSEDDVCALLALYATIQKKAILVNDTTCLVLALTHEKLALASCLRTLSVPWPPQVSLLCIVASAASPKSVEWLIEHNYPIDAKDAPALKLALTMHGHRWTTRALREHERRSAIGYRLLTHNAYLAQLTPAPCLRRAIQGGFVDAALALHQHVATDVDTSDLAPVADANLVLALRPPWALNWACCANSPLANVRSLIQRQSRLQRGLLLRGRPAASWAVQFQRLDILRVLLVLEGPWCLHELDAKGRSVLHYGVQQLSTELLTFLWSHLPHPSSSSSLLATAIRANQLNIAQWLASKSDICWRDPVSTRRDTLLHVACAAGHLALVEWLEAICPELVSVANDDGYVPYDYLAFFGHPMGASRSASYRAAIHPHSLKLFFTDTSEPSWRPLLGALRSLLAAPANTTQHLIVSRCTDGYYRVHAACGRNAVGHLTQLAAHGLSLTARSKRFHNLTPLQYAARRGAMDAMECLLDHGVVDTAWADGNALYEAATKTTRQHAHIVERLLSLPLADAETYLGRLRGDGSTPTLLHYVARSPYAQGAIDCLLDTYHAEIDVVDAMGCTPVQYALVSGATRTFLHLLRRGARLEAEYEGQSALYYTLQLLPSDIWRLFLQRGWRDYVRCFWR